MLQAVIYFEHNVPTQRQLHAFHILRMLTMTWSLLYLLFDSLLLVQLAQIVVFILVILQLSY